MVLRGSANGPWSSLQPDGTAETIDRQNPYHQALACKMALSDDMGALAARDAEIPRPAGNRKYFTQLESVVCVFPALVGRLRRPVRLQGQDARVPRVLQLAVRTRRIPAGAGTWQALIGDLGLVNGGEAQADEGGQTSALALVSEYRQRIDAFHRRGLHELVPVPLTHDGEAVQPGTCQRSSGPPATLRSLVARKRQEPPAEALPPEH